jgi:hypothetical protein
LLRGKAALDEFVERGSWLWVTHGHIMSDAVGFD